jgi:hypothetical protein
MSPTSRFQQGEGERRAFISSTYAYPVILSEVRRQPNEVEGPLRCLPYSEGWNPQKDRVFSVLCAFMGRKGLSEQKLFSPQLLNRIPQLGSLLKLKLLGRLPHIAFELHDEGLQLFL